MEVPCQSTYDEIHLIIVSTGYESNIFNTYGNPSDLNEFTNKHGCKLALIYSDGFVYKPDTVNDIWTENKHTIEDYNLIVDIVKYNEQNYQEIKNKSRDVAMASFMVFETYCDDNNTDGSKAFNLLADINKLEICRIWSCYHVDFSSLRKSHFAILAYFDAEGG